MHFDLFAPTFFIFNDLHPARRTIFVATIFQQHCCFYLLYTVDIDCLYTFLFLRDSVFTYYLYQHLFSEWNKNAHGQNYSDLRERVHLLAFISAVIQGNLNNRIKFVQSFWIRLKIFNNKILYKSFCSNYPCISSNLNNQ